MTLALPTPEIIIGPMLSALDLFGIAVFATSGALAAARKEQTLVTFAFFALVTGVGGGTIRDLLINAPVFWIRDAVVPLVILIVVLLVWMTPQRWWKGKMLDWFDAAGLAAYSVFGAAKSLEYGVPPLPAAMMGVITACAGGIIRDVLAGEPSILLRPELYVTAAALASALFVVLQFTSLPVPVTAMLSALAGFALRGAAIHYRLALPGYGNRRDA